MAERLFHYELSKRAVEAAVNLLEHSNYIIGDVIVHDMQKHHPVLYRFIESESKKYVQRGSFLRGSGIGYCLLGNPEYNEKFIKLDAEDLKVHLQNKNEFEDGSGSGLIWVSEGLLAKSGDLAYVMSGMFESPTKDAKQISFLSGVADAALPFISKIEAINFAKKFRVL